MGCKGSGFLRNIITEAALGFQLLEMEPAFSNNHISSSMNFWYLGWMEYGLCTIVGPMVVISITNRLVLLTYVEDLDFLSN